MKVFAVIAGCLLFGAAVAPSCGGPPPPTVISSCETIPAAGNYTLNADLPNTFACIQINGVGSVTLDCAGHSLGSFLLSNAPATTISHCRTTVSSTASTSDGLYLSADTFAGGGQNPIQIASTDSPTVTGSTFNASTWLQLNHVSDANINTNTFNGDTSGAWAEQIDDVSGTANRIDSNTLHGAGTRTPTTAGFDDGIFLTDVGQDIVINNHLDGYWDAGLETSALVHDTTITNNTVANAGIGYGGWYWDSFRSNIVTGNTADNVDILFDFSNSYGGGYGGTTVYFTDNQFTNNTATNLTGSRGVSSVFDFHTSNGPYYDYPSGQPMPPGTVETIIATNNTFTANNFDPPVLAPSMSPVSAYTDGGQNVCGAPPSNPYPLGCLSSPPVTRNGQQLFIGTQPYQPVGFNLWRANVSFALPNTGYLVNNGTTLADSLDSIHAGCPSCNTIRAWFLQQEVTPTTSGYNWAPFDKTLQVAAAHGYKVIATLADEWDYETANLVQAWLLLPWYQSGYKTDVHRGTGANGTTYNENVPYRTYVQDVVNRYRNDPTIAAWELTNEGEAVSTPTESCPNETTAATAMRAFADDVGGLIHSLDPNHLVSLGVVGAGACGTNEGDYLTVMGSPGIDVCSFHDYEGATNSTAFETNNGLNVRVSQCGAIHKPIIVGEVGVSRTDPAVNNDLSARATLIGNKYAGELAQTGVVGFVPWTWDQRCGTTCADKYGYGPGDPSLAVLHP